MYINLLNYSIHQMMHQLLFSGIYYLVGYSPIYPWNHSCAQFQTTTYKYPLIQHRNIQVYGSEIESNTDNFNINCDGYIRSCAYSTVNCPVSGECSISCNADTSCACCNILATCFGQHSAINFIRLIRINFIPFIFDIIK